jgi:hypothetical protein
MTSKTTARIQSRGYRLDSTGKITRRFRNMDTGEWFTRTVRANSAKAVAVIRRANAKAAS